jgi:A/G-specific adenine glycosylase
MTPPTDETLEAWLTPARVRRIQRRILRWGRANYQTYQWRDETDPWLTLATELLLQRTRAAQVEPVFRELRERYGTAASLVDAGPDAATAVMERLGLHWRGRLLYSVAGEVARSGGAPPRSLEELRKLAGVGMYTAAAWLSLHAGQRAAIVDSNVARWLSRMTGRPYPRDPRPVRWVHGLADALTPRRAFRAYNYAVLDFTMQVCTPRAPRCADCPVRADCAFGRAARPGPRDARTTVHTAESLTEDAG